MEGFGIPRPGMDGSIQISKAGLGKSYEGDEAAGARRWGTLLITRAAGEVI